MTVVELKKKVESNTLSDEMQVWLMSDYSSYFIAWQYINLIASNKQLDIKRIDSTKEIGSAGFFDTGYLYVIESDELAVSEKKDNLIILCNKTNYEAAVKFPKLEDWLFKDYLLSKVPGVDDKDLEWLIIQYTQTDSRVTKLNHNRLSLDMDKLSIFPQSVQSSLFNELYKCGEYDTVSNLTIFDLTNAIIRKDIKVATAVLKAYDYIDSLPHVWLLSILLNSFYNILAVTAEPNITAEELGITDKLLFVIKKYNLGKYDIKRLIDIYELLTNCEYMYKFGGLKQEDLSDYIICNILM